MWNNIKCFFGKHKMQEDYFWFIEEKRVFLLGKGKFKKTYKRCSRCGDVKFHKHMRNPKIGK